MKPRLGSSGKPPGPPRPTPDGKVVKECAMELREIGDLYNFLQLMFNTIKVFQQST